MASNSKPLRWEDPIYELGSFWAMELRTGDADQEADARAKLKADIGDVDEHFIHLYKSKARSHLSYMIVQREETQGVKAPDEFHAFCLANSSVNDAASTTS